MEHEEIRAGLAVALETMGVSGAKIQLVRPKDPSHGDVACSVAMTLAGELKKAPRQIAEDIVAALDLGAMGVEAAEIAGPGFLNFRLSAGAVASILGEILTKDRDFGRTETGAGQSVMVEFVSANPTGPLHLGHARQAALGDAVAELLDWTGWTVHREYYYNDGGLQMERLAESVRARYLQHFGHEAEIPEGGYHGDYVIDIARSLVDDHGDRFIADASPEAMDAIRSMAVKIVRADQDRDLGQFRVHFDEYYLESSLYDEGRVDGTIQALKDTGLTYELDGATWLKTTEFGDQKDRVMVR
ncbi:MAG: arginine--tRNA ligase, partial [Gemmatimonadales bacterium]|nr:arginine--tRNA ligase [Gemmatimonadales bacterium]